MLAAHPWLYALLFAVGLIAGTVDAIAGGGGLITLPVLLNLGLPPASALGTNKLQASFGSTSAAWHYERAGLVEIRRCGLGIICTLVGALGGAFSVQHLSPHFLQQVIPWLLVAVAIYIFARPRLGERDSVARGPNAFLFVVAGLALGFYDGFLGPGTGSFWTLLLITWGGYHFLRATATTKVMNATSNLASLAWFLIGGTVDFRAGLVMGVGQLLGARLGTRLAVTRGARFVRPVFLAMVVALTARLLYVQFAP